MNTSESRYYTVAAIFLVTALIYTLKLFTIQVLDDSYKEAAAGNYRTEITEYPYRGLIFDRNDQLLVYNEPIFDIMVIPNEVDLKDTSEFCRLLNIDMATFNENMAKARDHATYKPSIFLKQVSQKEFAGIQDRLIEFPGFFPQERTVRRYSYDNAAHVLGYMREIDKAQLSEKKDEGYKQGDYIGIAGLEAYYEEALRGKRGKRFIMQNVKGINKGSYAEGRYDIPSEPGLNLTTTLDIQLQQYVETLFKGKTGAAVAIEPETGEILTYVSAPTYNPNLLTGRNIGKHYKKLQEDTLKPLFNRAIMADQYPPGSIFKTAQALVALEEGVIKPSTRFFCNRSIINCHGDHVFEDLVGAIKHSCNPYFWNVFKKVVNQNKSSNRYFDTEIGLINWRKHMLTFGFGQKLGVDLYNEKSGRIPTVELYNRYYGEGRWKFSTIYSLSIGQGEIGIYPLQMANFAAVLANKGYYYTPHLVREIGRDSILSRFKEKHVTSVDTSHFSVVQEGMRQVVAGGTGFRARLDSIVVCGKTGTSQNPHGEDHSVFIAFAPMDNPKIAVAVYVENSGQGARAAASIAGLTIEKYLTGKISKRRKYIEDYVFRNHFIY